MPPIWKIKRELLGLYDQIKAILLILLTPLRKFFYDRYELNEINVIHGDRCLQEKLVIFLVFQPNGLSESIFESIRYIVQQSYEILFISNGKIKESDINKIIPLCWRVIERKNIGYDFGGYRCGLHYLKNQNIFPENLTLINDSVWFPLIPDLDFLNQTECIDSDFGGAVFLSNSKRKNKGLVLSYWLTIRKSLLQTSQFWSYWRKYIPTSNKTLTVKRGERGLSHHMYLAGLDLDGVFSTEKFLNVIHDASHCQLKLTLKYGSFTDPAFQDECTQLYDMAEETDLWRNSCLDFINRVVKRRNFLHSFCYPCVAILRVPFIKKNNLRLQVLMRQKYLQAVYAGDLPSPSPSILKEIEISADFSNQSAAFR